MVEDVLKKIGQNQFEFEELNYEDEEDLIDFFKSYYNSFLKTVPAIEVMWEKNQKPKLIIAETFAIYARYLAKKHGIPLLVFHSTYFSFHYRDNQYQAQYIEGLKNFTREKSLAALEEEVAMKYQVRINNVYDLIIEGDLNFSCIPKFIGDLVSVEKENFRYLGPAYRDESVTDEEFMGFDPNFQKDDRVIYVSLGTASHNIEGFWFYDTIIEALKDTEHKVLISAAHGKDKELIAKGLPRNIVVKNCVPQIKVLERSKLFISHVGSGGFMEALSKGVPLIAAPIALDQPINAGLVEKLGVGKYIKDKSVESVRKLVTEVLESEAIKENCEKYMKMIDPIDSKASFIEIVKSMMS